MGKADLTEKNLLRYKDVFSDVANVNLFHGEKVLELCYNAINDGAAGVDMGRNVFQSESPAAMIQAVHAVVHDGLTPEQGFEMFQDLSK